jgi:hypothetical protein
LYSSNYDISFIPEPEWWLEDNERDILETLDDSGQPVFPKSGHNPFIFPSYSEIITTSWLRTWNIL